VKRALPVLVLTVAGLVPVWRYAPSQESASTGEAAAAPAPAASAPATSSDVLAGPIVPTEKGDVQVEVTFEGERIAAVRMLRQPNHPQTANAVPRLIEETLRAQSADIDTVSGATLTSEGYRQSLQAALDERAAASAAPSPASQVVAGPIVPTEKGDVQVEVTFEGERIAAVRMLRQPNHPQTANAVPRLIEETLRAQSADIDTVSGATLTSEGYRQSLQAALDAQGA
jgi:uncharacterized protein with FMN-binding domain